MTKMRSDPGLFRVVRGSSQTYTPISEFLAGANPRAPTSALSATVEDLPTLRRIRLDGMRVLLVIGPAATEDYAESGGAGDKSDLFPSLGVINLVSFLRAFGADVRVHDTFASDDFNAAEKTLLSDVSALTGALAASPSPEIRKLVVRWASLLDAESFDLIGFSTFNEADPLSYLLLSRQLRAVGQCPPVVVGGSHWSYPTTLPWLDEFDAAVAGEGEVPLLLLCNAVFNESHGRERDELRRVPGVARLHGDTWDKSAVELSMNLRAAPRLDGVPLSQYHGQTYADFDGVPIPYQMSVGCPHNCAYCNNASKGRFKARHPKRVLWDLERLHERFGVRNLFLLNSDFNSHPGYASAILDDLIASEREFEWCDSARPSRRVRERLQRMRRAGCKWLNWGYDTLSERLARLYDRRIDLEELGETLKQSADAGIRNSINLVVGMPHESQEDVEALFAFLDRYHAVVHQVFSQTYQFVPSSSIGLNPAHYGLAPRADMSGVDEVGGLSWPERQAHGKASLDHIQRALFERYGYRYEVCWRRP